MPHDSIGPASSPTISIPGWPVVAPGLLMATFENVVFMHVDGRMPDDSYALYLRALEASLGHRQANVRVAVVYDIPTFSGLRAMGAREAGELFLRHRQVLHETTACFALVSPSSLARVAAQTVLTMSRLPFPQHTTRSLRSALAFAATKLPPPAIDVASVEQRIHDTLRHDRRIRGI